MVDCAEGVAATLTPTDGFAVRDVAETRPLKRLSERVAAVHNRELESHGLVDCKCGNCS
jgi:hypothetical protein